MRHIPVHPDLPTVYITHEPHVYDGVQVTNREGVPIVKMSCFVEPYDGMPMDTLIVRLPVTALPKELVTYTPVRFDRLFGKEWTRDGRSGTSFTADGVRVRSASKGAA